MTLTKALGGGKDADAYHILCATWAGADFFLTADKRLVNSARQQKAIELKTRLAFPTELVESLVHET